MDRSQIDDTAFASIAPEVNAVFCQFGHRQTAALVRAVLRGERRLFDLAAAGIPPNDPLSGAAKLAGLPVWSADFAEGMLNLKSDAAALAEWAVFVVRVADCFDYASHDIPCCEKLMSYIWRIAYGTGLSPRAITLATMLRNWPRKWAG